MSTKEPDFDIENYNLEELLTIFGIESPIQKEAIMEMRGVEEEEADKILTGIGDEFLITTDFGEVNEVGDSK